LKKILTISQPRSARFSFVEALEASHPGFIVRWIGGVFFLSGMLLMAYNTFRTVRSRATVALSDSAEPRLA
jgi:cytochrome c oxidase cbb3-type subunit 1